MDEALDIYRNSIGENHVDYVGALQLQARYFSKSRQWDKAEGAWRASLQRAIAVRGDKHHLAMIAKAELANIYIAAKQYEDAERILREILEERRTQLGETHVQTYVTMNNLAEALSGMGRYSESVELFQTAWEGQRATLGARNRETLICQGYLLEALCRLRRWDEAEALALDALMQMESLGPGDSLRLVVLKSLIQAHVETGRFEEALARCNEAMELEYVRRNDLERANVLRLRGNCLTELKRFEEAESDLLAAYGHLAEADDAGSDARAAAAARLVRLYEGWDAVEPNRGHADQAEKWRAALNPANTP